ncbi:MAG: hypothetical protein KDB07_12825, partial [Planctomycetes bacterium]|nr:hypothetical protein [Planctomycetota bacterium]
SNSLEESERWEAIELTPETFESFSGKQTFAAPVVDILVAVPEVDSDAHYMQASVILEDGWVFPYTIKPQESALVASPRAPPFNVFSVNQHDGRLWSTQLDALGASEGDLKLTKAALILGNTTMVFGDSRGGLQAWFVVIDKQTNKRQYQRIRAYDPLPSAIETISISQRSKSFLVGDKGGSLRGINMTTARVFLDTSVDDPLATLHYGREGDGIFGWDKKNRLHTWWFDAPHADASFSSIFTPVHYENFQESKFEWQSTGSDESEPKLSLIPLTIGTLKGALYAMLFSIPVAIFAALYTSEFMSPRLRNIVKPVMEVMASLPSVVLGFVAALVLAPHFESSVTSVLVMVAIAPLCFLIAGWIW